MLVNYRNCAMDLLDYISAGKDDFFNIWICVVLMLIVVETTYNSGELAQLFPDRICLFSGPKPCITVFENYFIKNYFCL